MDQIDISQIAYEHQILWKQPIYQNSFKNITGLTPTFLREMVIAPPFPYWPRFNPKLYNQFPKKYNKYILAKATYFIKKQ